jgi:hypothetical protein
MMTINIHNVVTIKKEIVSIKDDTGVHQFFIDETTFTDTKGESFIVQAFLDKKMENYNGTV